MTGEYPERSPSLVTAISVILLGVAGAAAVVAWFLGWTGERW